MHVSRPIVVVTILLIFIAISVGCAYSKKDVVQTPCTIPDTVSYSRDIVPIIQGNCAACHSSASNVSGILLDNFNGLKFYAQNGYLYGTISHSAGYRAMPDGGAKLNDCTINTIKRWIDQGTRP